MTVINLESVANLIREIDNVFEHHNCNIADKQYILNEMLKKINAEIQQQRTQDLMGKIDPGEMLKRIMKRGE